MAGSMPKPVVGILGTGRMGSAAARRLTSLGFDVVLWNRTLEKAKALAEELGASYADSPQRAVERAQYALLFLADDDALLAVLSTLRRMDGLAVINHGTHTPRVSSYARNYIEGNGGCYIEAPVVAGPRVLSRGEAILIVGGRTICVNSARPVIEALSSYSIYVGEEPGQAMALKLAFNNLLISTVNSLAESLQLAEAYGVEKDILKDLLSKTVFAMIGEKYIDRMKRSPEEPASFRLVLAAKDLDYAVRAGRDKGLPLMAASCTSQKYLAAATIGRLEEADYTRIYWFKPGGKEEAARQE